ncbi:glycosyltransferase family 2 protein [Sphingobacterium sp. NPDC055431]
MDENKQRNVDVSVVMTTYGHEDFILKAINGVVSQEFNGVIELIIANDKSPDNTHQVVEKYIKENPCPPNVIIRYYNHEVNKGSIGNFLWIINQAKGRFLAVCEGDDFWICPHKLEKQVTFLTNNPEYSIVFSNVHVKIESGKFNQTNELTKVEMNREYQGSEILENWTAHTSTFLIRNSSEMKNFEEFFKKHNFMYGDTPLFLYALTFGKGYGTIDYTSTYRRHEGGLTNQVQDNNFYIKFINYLISIKSAFANESYNKVLNKSIRGFYLRLYFNTSKIKLDKYMFLFKAMKYDRWFIFNLIREKLSRRMEVGQYLKK